MISPSLTDLDSPGVVADCRAEYERAERTMTGLQAWALKWARPMLDHVANPHPDVVRDLEEDLAEAEEGRDETRGELDSLEGAVQDAIEALRKIVLDYAKRNDPSLCERLDQIAAELEIA